MKLLKQVSNKAAEHSSLAKKHSDLEVGQRPDAETPQLMILNSQSQAVLDTVSVNLA